MNLFMLVYVSVPCYADVKSTEELSMGLLIALLIGAVAGFHEVLLGILAEEEDRARFRPERRIGTSAAKRDRP